jgi:anthranilate phosphoribosyltransferase
MSDIKCKEVLVKLAHGEQLLETELSEFFSAILDEKVKPSQIGAFLMGLERTGLDKAALVAGAAAMRNQMLRVEIGYPTIDVCGTGGDNSHSLNISTATSFVLAGGGIKVAKHGNRSMSSLCGAADVLEQLGINLSSDSEKYQKSLDDANIAFFFAPSHHPKLAYVGPIRRELGFGTIFNLLGPMCNPTGATKQLMGVYRRELLGTMAAALKDLGSDSAWIVHGENGFDEAVLHGETEVVELKNSKLRSFTISPSDANLNIAPADALKGGDAKYNAAALFAVLKGEKCAYRDAVVFNAACALVMAGYANDLKMGAEIAAASIDTECALQALSTLKAITNS